MLPVIGILCHENPTEPLFLLHQDYIAAVEAAAAIPLIVPITLHTSTLYGLLQLCDGLIFSGGGDVAPELTPHLPQERAYFQNIDPKRDACELFLLQQVFEKKIPFLGICRGCQLLNVATGGTLIAHLEHHMQEESRSWPSHGIRVQSEIWLKACPPPQNLRVNSFHHQAIRQPGKDLLPAAWAEDGTIEAVVHARLPFCVGVQWHPEALRDEFAHQLFLSLVQAASEFQQKKHGCPYTKIDFYEAGV